jgi:hypothetical protein
MADPVIIEGAQSSAGSNTGELSNRLVLEIGNEIWKQGANMAALSWLCDRNKKTVDQQIYRILEDFDLPRQDTINGGTLTAGTTTITVSNSDRWRVGHIWKNDRTGEQVKVQSKSGAVVTVIRGYSSVNAGTGIALTDGDTWRRLANNSDENASAGTSQQSKVSERVNYAQFMSLTTGVTEIRNHSKEYGMDELLRQRSNTRRQWLLDKEYAFLLQDPLNDVQGSSPLDSSLVSTSRMTGGLKYWIDTDASSNIIDAGGVLSKLDFMDICATLAKEAPENMGNGEVELVALCGQKAAAAINMLQFNAVRTKSGEKSFGFNTQEIVFPFATVKVHQHGLLQGEYEDYMFLVNPKYVGTRVMSGLDVKVRDVSEPKSHSIEEEIYAVHGFWLTLPELHGYVKNFRMAA